MAEVDDEQDWICRSQEGDHAANGTARLPGRQIEPRHEAQPKKLRFPLRNFSELEPDKRHYVNSDVADSKPLAAAILAPVLPRRQGKSAANQIAEYLFSPCNALRRQGQKFNNHGPIDGFWCLQA